MAKVCWRPCRHGFFDKRCTRTSIFARPLVPFRQRLAFRRCEWNARRLTHAVVILITSLESEARLCYSLVDHSPKGDEPCWRLPRAPLLQRSSFVAKLVSENSTSRNNKQGRRGDFGNEIQSTRSRKRHPRWRDIRGERGSFS